MIPKILPEITIHKTIANFLRSLKKTSFSGDIKGDLANRLIASTDNSIYQILPQAVVFPRTTQDIREIFQLANKTEFKSVTFSPRGGGTGTNGQSLSPSIIIDCSKYMNQVLEVNIKEKWVRVQPGIILDQLNQILAPHNLFFAPSLAPSNRATIGGMINTDAAGKGSRIYGKTSDHILALNWVLSDGTLGHSSQVNVERLNSLKQEEGRLGDIYKTIDTIVSKKSELIAKIFPKLTRFMTGYNLAKVYDETRNFFDINRILAGSEGTLGVITEAKLKLSKIPKYTKLLAIHYQNFDAALKNATQLLNYAPVAIETVDETILELAKNDPIFEEVKNLIGSAQAINLVEFMGNNNQDIEKQISPLIEKLQQKQNPGILGYYQTDKLDEIKKLWLLRKKGAALLGSMPGDRKPIAFIEDTAVSPSNLANYASEFKTLLNSYKLKYAIFGHVDVGCLHVRPALDMKVPTDEKLIREISDKVVNLVRRYGGIIWGEHGKGFRSEYTPLFFGEELYQDLRKIKQAFDPNNKLNPGKIVTPYNSTDEIVKLESTLRGQFDRQVSQQFRKEYEGAFNCNGNGACFNFNPDEIICPSAKQTRDRIHSPKGRAMLLREWLRLLSKLEVKKDNLSIPRKILHTLKKWQGKEDFSHDVYQAMQGCLACKGCVSQCPIHVDIPSLKSLFLERYHSRYLRPIRDYLMANIEQLAYYQSFAPNLFNNLLQNPLSKSLIGKGVKLVEPPLISSLILRQELTIELNLEKIKKLSTEERKNSIILLQDAFTSFYESQLVVDTYKFFKNLGYNVYILPFFINGKPLYLKGFIKVFKTLVKQNIKHLKTVLDLDIPVIGIEPSMTLTYRDEYDKIARNENIFKKVQLIQEFLVKQDKILPKINHTKPYHLLGHCHEKSLVFNSQKQWQMVFKNMGISLNLVSVGCCGMAGMYGHEREHYDNSKDIYRSSWQQHLPENIEDRPYYLVTGYSCRSQVKRLSGWKAKHPIQALNKLISFSKNNSS
ncbi:FAD-binding and (Fe-S)-binding domain-containing protein [Crocosphaera sp.]|uniref:FAD-binding and (Fe-S)-binding domain-containing protein n=1 Tax=Crocosphaera sp. TaxID=2729996 RepID=UPI002617EE7A|nr:FAD-binding and (Fe-S)-binding domain-containing protein [Crocosphaera sp.]MDJ0582903.1 FAD-binding and (Fe-S)-binding domain-containing protein [Crocosphaera sp.]